MWKGIVRWRDTPPPRLLSYWWLDLVLLGSVDLATSWPGSERHLPVVCLSTEVLLLLQAQGFLIGFTTAPRDHDYICSTPSKPRSHLLALGPLLVPAPAQAAPFWSLWRRNFFSKSDTRTRKMAPSEKCLPSKHGGQNLDSQHRTRKLARPCAVCNPSTGGGGGEGWEERVEIGSSLYLHGSRRSRSQPLSLISCSVRGYCLHVCVFRVPCVLSLWAETVSYSSLRE